MKLREVYRYEVEYRLKNATTWMYAAFMLLLAGWWLAVTAEGEGFVNKPERIALASTLASTIGLLVIAALFGDAAVRDVESRMDSMLYTSPLRKIDYLGGRFLAAFTVNALIALTIPVGVFASAMLMRHFEPDIVGPFRLLAFVQPFVLLVLPNILLGGAVLFATGVLARHIVPVFLVAIAFLITAVSAMNLLEGTTSRWLLVLSDPLGLQTFRSGFKYWTEVEKNTRLIGFPVALMLNRVFWLGVAASIFGLLLRSFAFRHGDESGRKWRFRWLNGMRTIAEANAVADAKRFEDAGPVEVPRIAGVFGRWSGTRQTFAIARNSLHELTGSRWFVAVLLACTGLTMLFGWNVGSTAFDTSTLPVTFLVADVVLSERISPVIYSLILLYAGELVWKDRSANVDEIADAIPVSEGSVFAGRFLALAIMIIMFVLAMMIGGLLIQALQGYYHFEFGLYLRTLFGINLATYLLFALFAMTVQVIVQQKYVAHIVLLLALVAQISLHMGGYIQHHLLLYNTDPGFTYSEMNGFGPFMKAVIWFKMYWAAWGLLLSIIATAFWVRGREPGVRRRLSAARARLFSVSLRRLAATAAALIVGLGGFIFYNTNVLNAYVSSSNAGEMRAEYERRYGQYRETPQPVVTNADLRFEIYPEQPALDITGAFRLVNQTAHAVDSVHVLLYDPQVQLRNATFDRTAKAVVSDDERKYWIYTLERPLQPGDSMQLKFDVTFRPQGFTNNRSQINVVANGSSFDRRFLPMVGYQPMLEVTDPKLREKFSLGAQVHLSDAEGVETRRRAAGDADEVQVHSIIGTAIDQTAVTPGVLKRKWTENNRAYFEYETATPVSFGSVLVSANYAVVSDKWRDVSLQIFHHPGHTVNIDRTIKSMKASLEYYTEQFGPYPDNQLRIVEKPRYGGFGSAHPNVITFTEDYFLSDVKDGEVDQPFYGTAHEVAHSWWDGRIRSKPAKGQSFLTESAANYSAMMMTEKAYGVEAANRVYDFQMMRYLEGRSNQSNEVPLLDVEEQPYIAYRKGAIALYALRRAIGDTAVNGALRRFQNKYSDMSIARPTSRDLYAELKAITPDSLHSFLYDWFETVTLWDVKADKANVEKLADGTYQISVDIMARKLRADSVGNETEIPMDEFVEIGAYAASKAVVSGDQQYLGRHRLHSGKQTIRIIVSKPPVRVAIDPVWKLIDRERADNSVDLKE